MDFKEKKEYILKNRTLDIQKFGSVKEVTQMVDFINQEREQKAEKWADNEIHEVSKFLAKTMNQKLFFLGK